MPSGATPSAAPESGGSGLVILAGVVLAIFGVLLLLFGGLIVLSGAVFTSVFTTSDTGVTPGLAQLTGGILVVFGAVFAAYGIFELIAAIGILMRRQWGRFLGVVLSVIAGIFTTVVAIGAVSDVGRVGVGGLLFGVVPAIGYWFIVIALARGGAAFRRA